MKKFLTSVIAVAIVACITSCGEKKEPVDRVREYAKYFAEKVAANQLDSVANVYQDIVKADSIVAFPNDTIIVTETVTPGVFDVELADGVTFTVTLNDDGTLLIPESYGLFAFPADKIEIAKKTGMWDYTLNDAKLADRMKDQDFFDMMAQKGQINPDEIIKISEMTIVEDWNGVESDAGTGFYTLTNTTDKPISASDYTIIKKRENVYEGTSTTYEEPGVYIEPNGSVKVDVTFRPMSDNSVKSVRFNLSDEELFSKFSPFTGKEYQEYLNSKK